MPSDSSPERAVAARRPRCCTSTRPQVATSRRYRSTDPASRRSRQGSGSPVDGAGSSRLAPSLARAAELVAAHPDHQTTLIVLSDFLLLDNDPTAVLAKLGRFPGTVHAVVLGRRRDALVPSDVASVIHVGWNDPPGAVAKAVFASLTRARPGSRAYKAAGPQHDRVTSQI